MKKPLSYALLFVFGFVFACGRLGMAAMGDGACRDDVKKLCGDVTPGNGAIADCMKSHESDLSQGCKDNMAAMKSKMEERKKELEAACGADLKQFCANVTPGQGREMACLISYSDKVSPGCKEKLPKRGMMRKGMHHGDHDRDHGNQGTPSDQPQSGGDANGQDGPPEGK